MTEDMGTGNVPAGTPLGQPQWEIGQLFSEGWRLLQDNLALLLGGFLIMALVIAAANSASMGLASLVLSGPFALGLFTLALKLLRGEEADFNVLLSGFKRFLPAFLANLLITVFSVIGTLLCIIPGLFVGLIYMLTYLYMHDKELDFWPAMEASRKTVMDNLGKWIVLWLVLLALNFAGALACGVGLILTVPLTIAILAVAYDKTEGGAVVEATADDTI
jgi:uncharacterized membrane protein